MAANPEEKYGDSSLGAVPGKEAKVQETKEQPQTVVVVDDDNDDDDGVASMSAKTATDNMDARTTTTVVEERPPTLPVAQNEPASPRPMDGIQRYTQAKELIEQIEAIRAKWSPHSAMWPLHFTQDIQ